MVSEKGAASDNVSAVGTDPPDPRAAPDPPDPRALKCVARRSELAKSGQISKWVDDHDLLIFEHHGKVKVLSNICPHLGGPVGYHKQKDGRFTCLWHNFQFSVDSGQCIEHPKLCLREYKTEVRGDEIWVQLVENV